MKPHNDNHNTTTFKDGNGQGNGKSHKNGNGHGNGQGHHTRKQRRENRENQARGGNGSLSTKVYQPREEMQDLNKGGKDVGIIGFGVVGSATGRGLQSIGHTIYINDIKDLKDYEDEFTVLKPYDLDRTEYTIITLPTPTVPLTLEGRIDLSIIDETAERLGKALRHHDAYHTFIMRSTVVPGTTRKFGEQIADIAGKRVGDDFGLVMNPEFLRAFNNEEDFKNPRVTIIGEYDEQSGAGVEALYRPLGQPIQRMGLEEAELTKYWNNIYNAIKISAHNELWKVAGDLGIDFESVRGAVVKTAEASWNPEYGTHGGLPYGGSCLPKDTLGLRAYLADKLITAPLLEATIRVNESMQQASKEGSNGFNHEYFRGRQHATYDNLNGIDLRS